MWFLLLLSSTYFYLTSSFILIENSTLLTLYFFIISFHFSVLIIQRLSLFPEVSSVPLLHYSSLEESILEKFKTRSVSFSWRMALNEIIQILPNSPTWIKITERLKEKWPLDWRLWKKKKWHQLCRCPICQPRFQGGIYYHGLKVPPVGNKYVLKAPIRL